MNRSVSYGNNATWRYLQLKNIELRFEFNGDFALTAGVKSKMVRPQWHRLQSNRWVGYERNHRKSRHGYPMFRITCSLPYIRHRSWRWVNPFLQHSKRQLFQKFSCIGFIRKRNATRGLLGYLITLKHKQVILTKNKAWAVVCTYYKKTKRARD